MKSIGVIGGGAWGTALAQVQASNGRETLLWARETEVADSINAHHVNEMFLPDVQLDERLKATNDLAKMAEMDILLTVTPAQFMRVGLEALKQHLGNSRPPIVICSKGIEIETGDLLISAAKAVMGNDYPLAMLTGPTFAKEIAMGLPAAITIAAQGDSLLDDLKKNVGAKTLRPYVTDDVIAAQLGGAVKNVIAIATGVATGRKLGDSARAAIITRGLAEMVRLCEAMGGQETTLLDMCGLGDLVLTCSSMQSRNCSLGSALGEGKTLDEVLGSRNSVTEGVYTAKAVVKLARSLGVEMPICEAVHAMLHEGEDVDSVIGTLLNRPFV